MVNHKEKTMSTYIDQNIRYSVTWGLQDVTGVGYLRVTLTWGITRLQKICTEPYVFSFFAGGSSSIVGNGSGSSKCGAARSERSSCWPAAVLLYEAAALHIQVSYIKKAQQESSN